MRITRWTTESLKKSGSPVFLSEPSIESENWTTVLIGRNGTKKSLLLRVLLEGVLGSHGFRQNGHPTIKPRLSFSTDTGVTGKVIAIAGTPFDRYPRQTLYQRPSNATRFDTDHRYVYLGLKSANGTMGAAHTVRTLAFLLLQGVEAVRKNTWAAREVLNFLGLAPRVKIFLRRSSQLNVSRRDRDGGRIGDFSFAKFDAFIESQLSKASLEESAELDLQFVELVSGSTARRATAEKLQRLSTTVVFSFDEDRLSWQSDGVPFQPSELLALIAGGLVTANHLMVDKVSEDSSKQVDESDLSSGQWHLMSSLLGLALSVEPGSLVLVDEPENSLHPEWQRGYIELLTKILKETNGCHTVIATHSPLIASGIDQNAGNVVQLLRDEDGPIGLGSRAVTVTYGWDASDVYQEVFGMSSTRAVSFVEQTDAILASIRDGEELEAPLREAISNLSDIAEALPQRDPMRRIVNAIVRAEGGNQEKRS
ncbi:putative ATPase_AAA_core domain-containing protein [Paraburkholderia tropica]|uniref:AAA family ATPase n=1 Tax=Paraburkholderia tropica TaxID=92647 RepID=UPI001CAA9D8D|nr:AAA family ATPase [Paraburkholderia tropica]CAG9217812.1 putative ATPase_AAA_core domain-containing protein [Paraburkholderia tropica]